MTLVADIVLAGGLDYFIANFARFDICSAAPATYAEATSTYSLGQKTGMSATGPADGAPDGRKVTIPEIVANDPGDVTASGTATHWAATDGVGNLLAAGLLSAAQGVTSGNMFTMGAIDVTMRDAVAV